MTGSILPQGADTVVKVEHASEREDWVRVVKEDRCSHIRQRGEDVTAGDVVLRRGTRISPPVMAVLASVGCDPVAVARRPSVAIIATGSELVEPWHTPGDVQIRNSNACQLSSQVGRAGCMFTYLGIAQDAPDRIGATIEYALTKADVVLISGGVSMGTFDFVPGILRDQGAQVRFQRVAVKPGKPTVFAVHRDKFVFGMPGNPVSALVIFDVLVKPFLSALMGHAPRTQTPLLRLAREIRREVADRHEFRPVRITEDGSVEALEYHGSAHIHSYVQADGMVAFPVGVSVLNGGVYVGVHLF